MRPAVLIISVAMVLATSVQADWWDDLTDKINDTLNNTAVWVKESASPAIRDKFTENKEKLQDPKTYNDFRTWLSEKYGAAANFTKEEIVPELIEMYEAATANVTTSEPKKNDD